MKWIGVALALLASGCSSHREMRWTDVPLTPANIDKLDGGGAEVTLVNGEVVILIGAAAYGDVLCDEYACVRKSDITYMRSLSFDTKTEAVDPTVVLLAPLALPWLVMWVGQSSYDARGQCNNCPEDAFIHPKASAERHWIVSGFRTAEEWKHSRQVENPCKNLLPPDLQTDAQALHWTYENRKQILDVACLTSATVAITNGGAQSTSEQVLRMTMLLHARSAWISAHCRLDKYQRLTPRKAFAGSSVSQFDVIAEVLADDATYLLPEQTEPCPAGPKDFPTREDFARAMKPFPEPGTWYRIANRSRWNLTP